MANLKYKIGDRVMFTVGDDSLNGVPGVVVEVDEDDEEYPYMVYVRDGEGDPPTWYGDNELQPEQEVTK